MFSFFRKVFKRTQALIEDNEELRLFDEAFNALHRKKRYFDDMHRMYEAKYDEAELENLRVNNYNFIYVPLVRNIINTIVGHFHSAFFSGKNPIEIRSVLAENNDGLSGLNRLVQYYYEISGADEELLKAIRAALVYGFACVHIYWDKRKQKVVSKAINIDSFALDPTALSLQDAGYVCVKLRNTYEYWQDQFKEKIKSISPRKKTDIYELKQIYIKHLDGWEKKSFIDGICVEHLKGIERLPFCYGYALQKLSPVSESKMMRELCWLGDCLPRLLAAMQSEMNKKRNLKLDIDELKINPKGVYTQGFPIQILQQGPGSVAEILPGAEFKPIVFGGDVDIFRDIELINKEAEEASGVNSIHMGRTTSSDRRSATSLAIINSSSSVRIEEMIATINSTLFEHWCKHFVDLVIKNAPAKIKSELDVDVRLYEDTTTTLKVRFGSSFGVDKRIGELSSVLQMLSQNPNISPSILQGLLEELLILRLGDAYDVKKLFEPSESIKNQELGVL